MTTYTNPFVSILNRYTTVSPDHEAAFDEFVMQFEPSQGVELHLETTTERFLTTRFRSPNPPSVVLTGNAGDGKTYLCRRVIEAFGGAPVRAWEKSDWPVQRGDQTLRVVKDLSEIGEQDGVEILNALQNSLEQRSDNDLFLIAANEGRLRALLQHLSPGLLHEYVQKQLTSGPNENEQLVVLNLNRVTTSTYVEKILQAFTDVTKWEACNACPALNSCPIRFNRDRLVQHIPVQRLRLLYQLLEHLNIHVTIRDTLIHLAYAITGGLTCSEVITQRDNHWQPQNHVYYENVWGASTGSAIRSKMTIVQHLQPLDVGQRAQFEVDDFVINGGVDNSALKSEHDKLFVYAVDLNQKEFDQLRKNYLQVGATSPEPEKQHPLLDWLPHCRRKLFFEWSNQDKTYALLPFRFATTYLRLLRGERSEIMLVKRELVKGLNRAFSGLFVPQSDALYVTSQYAHAIEQPVPVIRLRRDMDNIKLELHPQLQRLLDQEQAVLRLTVLHPETGKLGEIPWDINLMRFEYLMRLAQGETHNVLARECELSIRKLKDRLLTSFGASSETDGHIEFFAMDHNRYVIKSLYLENGRIRV